MIIAVILILSYVHLQAQSRYGVNDTIMSVAVVYEGDTIEAKTLAGVYVWKRDPKAKAR